MLTLYDPVPTYLHVLLEGKQILDWFSQHSLGFWMDEPDVATTLVDLESSVQVDRIQRMQSYAIHFITWSPSGQLESPQGSGFHEERPESLRWATPPKGSTGQVDRAFARKMSVPFANMTASLFPYEIRESSQTRLSKTALYKIALVYGSKQPLSFC